MSDIQPDAAPMVEPPVEEAPKLTPQEQYLQAIADEIANDPYNMGYADKSPEEQAELLNNPWYQMVPQAMTPRIASIIGGIAFAPNAVSVDDLSVAAPLIAKAVEVQANRLKLER
jgi:hypothetical protein